jgi:hypothetical protein
MRPRSDDSVDVRPEIGLNRLCGSRIEIAKEQLRPAGGGTPSVVLDLARYIADLGWQCGRRLIHAIYRPM